MRVLPVLLLATLLVPATAGAMQEDLAWRLDSREVTMAATGGILHFSSTRASPLGHDELAGSFDADSARLDVRFTAQAPEPADAGFTLTWRRLVEYRDADGDGRLGLADPVVQTIAVPGLPATLTTTPSLSAGKSATATYTLPGNATPPLPVGDHGSFELTFNLVPQATVLAGGPALQPTDLGVLVAVDGVPFKEQTTRLAIEVVVSALGGQTPSLEDGGLVLESGPVTLSVRADAFAQTDGGQQPAPSTAVSDRSGSATLRQEIPRGGHTDHGSRVAVQRWQGVAGALADLPLGDWRFYALGLAVTVVGLGIPSLRRLREP